MNSEKLFELTDADSARARQREFSRCVVDRTPSGFGPRLVCGLDAAYKRGFGVGVATVWDLDASRVAETRSAMLRVPVDYSPGLLGFREGMLLVAAAEMLRGRADLFLTDGHGVAHPERLDWRVTWGSLWTSPPSALRNPFCTEEYKMERSLTKTGRFLAGFSRLEGRGVST